MPPNIRDEDTHRLAEKLALRNELDRVERTVLLRARLRPLQDRVMSRTETGMEADKTFYDALSGNG